MLPDDAFLNTIHAQPDDDAPRLVYADWLEETGDAVRAEFIRLQCAGRDPERQRELLAANGEMWAGPLFRQVYSYSFRRGLIEELTIDARMLLQSGALLFQHAPIRLLRVIGARRPAVATRRGRGLDLSGRPMLDELLRMPELSKLRALHLTSCVIGDEGASLVANCRHLARLQTLRLGDNALTDQAVEVLVESEYMRSLRTLSLSKNKIGDLGATLLAARRTSLETLQSLDLSDNLIGEVGAEALASSPGLPAIQRLDLSNQFKGWSSQYALRGPLNPIQPPQRRALIGRFGAGICVF